MSAGRVQFRRGVALALAAFAVAAHADYKDSYMRGKRAYDDGDYAKARELLQQALAEHPEPAARFNPYGKIYTPYIPQHYLGLIGLKQGDCAGVKAQWSSSENRQIMLQLPDIAAEEDQAAASCGSKVAEKPVQAPSPPVPEKAKPPVADDTQVKTMPAPPPKPPVEKPKPPVVDDTQVKTIPAPPPRPPVEKPPVAEKAAPPETLVKAYDSFLAGRYAEVERISPDSYGDARARFHAYLVRSAAEYTRARIETNDSLLAGAKADAAAARALDARAVPDSTLFSPAFREFYNASR